ncbi:MAG: S4 domain-containing protein [Candidatus Micrarchaeota archaeon]|nr:S4 domain-containing protein [Candidatus Micrarchaeota archaeon]
MAKKGGSHHMVRLVAKKRTGAVARKKLKWLLVPSPGPHPKADSIPVGVLIRDTFKWARNLAEAKRILKSGALLIDGRKVSDPHFPVGLMDIVSSPAQNKFYRISLKGPSLFPKEIKPEEAKSKYLKVIRKHTIKGGKINLTFHDGRNYVSDAHINTGDTCILSVPEFKLQSHIRLAPGAQCLVVEGKHRGEKARLEKIIERPGSHESEALLSGPEGEFITVLKYLFPIDENY